MRLTASVGEIVRYPSARPSDPELVEAGPPLAAEPTRTSTAALEAQRRRAGIFRRGEEVPRKTKAKAGIRRVEQEISPAPVHKENENMERVDETSTVAHNPVTAIGATPERHPVVGETREDQLLNVSVDQAEYMHRIAIASEKLAREPKLLEGIGRDLARGTAIGAGFILAVGIGNGLVALSNWMFGKKKVVPAVPVTPVNPM